MDSLSIWFIVTLSVSTDQSQTLPPDSSHFANYVVNWLVIMVLLLSQHEFINQVDNTIQADI